MTDIIENRNLKKEITQWRILDATTIKIIAIVLMFLDHIHQMYASQGAPLWLTILGRPVFPMLLFIAAESFHYTKSRKKYLKRLLISSWGMTILTTVLSSVFPNKDIILINNAFSTFFVVGMYVQSWDLIKKGIKEKKVSIIGMGLVFFFIPIIFTIPALFVGALSANENIPFIVIRILAMISISFPNILVIEGGVLMVLLGVLFYIFREKRVLQIVILFMVSLLVYILNPTNIQWYMCFAAIPMILYNGKKGYGMKSFFYIFYPAHIAILYLMATLL